MSVALRTERARMARGSKLGNQMMVGRVVANLSCFGLVECVLSGAGSHGWNDLSLDYVNFDVALHSSKSTQS